MSARARRAGTRSSGSTARGVAGPAFPIAEAKLSVPPPRPGLVPRHDLVQRLRASRAFPIVAMSAPPGYGKTTLLAQWAEADGRPVVWLTLDERDNDPSVLLTYLAAGMDRIRSIDPAIFGILASPGGPVPSKVVQQLAAALQEFDPPALLVLDDLHLLTDPVCTDAIGTLARGLPLGSQLALTGRGSGFPFPLARFRADGLCLEIGPKDLSLREDEARSLIRAMGVTLPDPDVEAIVRRTEGWPAGLYLAALSFRSGADREGFEPFSGSDRFLSDYLRSEILQQLPAKDLRFLTRTSVLSRMCGSLCDAVVGTRGSGETLERMEDSNLFLVPLDRRREWYRYHHLFRDALGLELERREPDQVPELRRRAAAWYERNRMPETAVEYYLAAGDPQRAAELIAAIAQPMYRTGRVATLERWLEWFEAREEMGSYAPLAVLGGWLRAMTGDAGGAQRWADAAEHTSFDGSLPDASPSIEPWIVLLRCLRCVDGLGQMPADAERALKVLPPTSFWYPSALVLLGAALILDGRPDGEPYLVKAAELAESARFYPNASLSLGELAALAASRDEWERAETAIERAGRIIDEARLDRYWSSGLAFAIGARLALRRGDLRQARVSLAKAQRLRPTLTHAIPWLSVQVRLELIRAHLALADPAGARTLLREIDDILRVCPDLGRLNLQVAEARRLVRSMPGGTAGVSSLTAAELRLIPYLHTHLSFREIAQRLFVSPNTVKTQAISLYRKLGVSSRSDAMARAEEVGLLEA